jgi:Putative Ig domain
VVSNTVGSVTSNPATLTVNPPPMQITTGSLADGQLQTVYSATLQATGGTAPYTWSLFSGPLPNGLTLSSSSGTISGTPTVAGLFNFTIQVRDTAGASASHGFSINIAAIAHWVDLSWNPSAAVVVGYNIYRGTTSGGPYTKLNSSVVPGITHTDSTVQSGVTYFYVATAVDANNVESAFSNEVSATIP